MTNPEYRVDCQPEGVADATICLERGCVYDEIYDAPGTPWCFFPVDYGYGLTGKPTGNDKGIVFNLVRNSVPSLFGNEWQSITLEVQYQTDDRLRVKVGDILFCRASFFNGKGLLFTYNFDYKKVGSGTFLMRGSK